MQGKRFIGILEYLYVWMMLGIFSILRIEDMKEKSIEVLCGLSDEAIETCDS